jgi:hypothetical protein
MVKRVTGPVRNEAKLFPVLAVGVPAALRPAVKMLLNWKFPVGLGGCKASRRSIRTSPPIFRLWRPRVQEKLSMNCVTEVVNSAFPLGGGPSCWKPTMS